MNVSITDILDQIIASLPLFRPELLLIVGFIASICSALFVEKRLKNFTSGVYLSTIVLSIYFLCAQLTTSATGFSGMWIVDKLSTYARLIIAFAAAIIGLFIQQRHKQDNNGDVYSVLLAAILGMNVLCNSSNWMLAFIGIEMVSIASYVLVGYFSKQKKQAEAAMKYALFGSVCAAIMLYGLSLIYGLTGSLDFQSPQQLQGLMVAPEPIVTIALLFVFVGIGFKLSFVPFHVWSPDVYEGAPTAITAFLSTIPKIGALILFTRLYTVWSSTAFYFSDLTSGFLLFVSIASMLVGNLAALRQKDIKRLMAYSSIGHTGFLLMAVFAYQDAFQYLLFYIVAYVLMNLATFIFIDALEERTGSTALSSYAGLGRKMPVLFTAFTLVAVSLIGLPPTMGFMGKLMIFSAVFDTYQMADEGIVLLLLVVGALTAVISLFYYFRIPFYAFLRNTESLQIGVAKSQILLWVGYLLTAFVILLGLFPGLLLNLITA
ncbi:NADH-quinone oxidoreductase subunit N [Sphingobacterium deserti]|uniref:NADH-quinone oxidoreductase subunit N n=1 Tax=Sphingobacterium deserti TaxID=1229276 RepID=A0A0B8T3W6_9SPHI|nr:NADH-quinone oxidoreductase subunit N [Sphingobacterium deserti]KGE13923.1 NAD(P)H-quinone oxidoreductase subunit 2 [Sphingobacterium deserti]